CPFDAGGELRDCSGGQDGRRRSHEHQLDERVTGYCPGLAAVTVMSGFIFRKLFSPTPLTFIRSSTFLKPPFFWRYSTIRSAILGPTPGMLVSCSAVAVLRLTGAAAVAVGLPAGDLLCALSAGALSAIAAIAAIRMRVIIVSSS